MKKKKIFKKKVINHQDCLKHGFQEIVPLQNYSFSIVPNFQDLCHSPTNGMRFYTSIKTHENLICLNEQDTSILTNEQTIDHSHLLIDLSSSTIMPAW